MPQGHITTTWPHEDFSTAKRLLGVPSNISRSLLRADSLSIERKMTIYCPELPTGSEREALAAYNARMDAEARDLTDGQRNRRFADRDLVPAQDRDLPFK